MRVLSGPFPALVVLGALLVAGGAGAWAAARESERPAVATSARLPVVEQRLDNGMRLLLVARPGGGTVAAGWVVAAGSVDERPGASGLAHLAEHMLFKGSRAIGTRNPDAESALLAEQDRLWDEIRRLESRRRPPAARLAERRQRFDELGERARSLALLGEFSLQYSRGGAVGLNANTLEDFSIYHVTLPSERLELWFWLEADRLRQPVFREFYKEKRVIAEERRMRVDSRPTGLQEDELRQAFWGDHAYAWRPLGRPEDLPRLSRADLREFYDAHYSPAAITAVLVGDFDPQRARELAELYFAPLPARRAAGPESAPPEAPVAASLELACECPPQVRALYRTVPFRHPDSYRLQVLAGLLNGRSGRLYRDLVLGREIAFSAAARQHPRALAGHFEFVAEAKGEATPRELLTAWNAELDRLAATAPAADELERVKNQIAADALRRLKEPQTLLRQLLIYAGLGEWREINDWLPRLLAVDGEAVRQAARRYLRPELATTAIFAPRPQPSAADAGSANP